MKNHLTKVGFDTRQYLKYQAEALKKALGKSHDKLYIEFGGKLLQDKHSARVLPGYHEDAKLELLKSFHNAGESIFVVSSRDIVRGRVRGDFGIAYDEETFRTIQELKKRDYMLDMLRLVYWNRISLFLVKLRNLSTD